MESSSMQNTLLEDYKKLIEENIMLKNQLNNVNKELTQLKNNDIIKLSVATNEKILYKAIENNDLVSVKFIVENGGKDEKALILALENNFLEIAKILIEHEIGIQYNKYESFICAAKNGYSDIIKLIIEKNKEIGSSLLLMNGSTVLTYNEYALQCAAENGYLDQFKYLISKTDVNIHFQKDYALRYAAMNGHLEIVEFIVENTIDIYAGYALQLAYKNNRLEVVKFLCEANTLNYSSKNDCLKIIKYLNENNIDYSKYIGNNEYYHSNILEFIEKSKHLHVGSGNPVLYEALEKNRIDVIKYLIDHGANIHKYNKQDHALQMAAQRGQLELVDYLIEIGCDIEKWNGRAFAWAVERGHFEVANFLISAGANVNSCSIINTLHKVIEEGHLNRIEYIFNHCNIKQFNITDLLRNCAIKGYLDIFKYIHEKTGANVHDNDDGALKCAIAHSHTEIAKYIRLN